MEAKETLTPGPPQTKKKRGFFGQKPFCDSEEYMIMRDTLT